jgi:hypothetical protein
MRGYNSLNGSLEKPLRVAEGDLAGQVREAIMTSALLKLPQRIPLEEKRRRVDMILEELVSAPSGNTFPPSFY